MIEIPTNGSIALVDDDDMDRMIVSRVLGISNLTNPVVGYPSAIEFIEDLTARAESGDVDLALVLLDVNMSGMSGLEALAYINAELDLPEPPVIVMLTGSEANSDAAKAEELGAQGYLTKQSGIEAFVAAVNAEFVNS